MSPQDLVKTQRSVVPRSQGYVVWCRYSRWQLEAAARQAEQAALEPRLRVLLAKQQAAERAEKQARASLPQDNPFGDEVGASL